MGRREKAIKDFPKVIDINPQDAKSYCDWDYIRSNNF